METINKITLGIILVLILISITLYISNNKINDLDDKISFLETQNCTIINNEYLNTSVDDRIIQEVNSSSLDILNNTLQKQITDIQRALGRAERKIDSLIIPKIEEVENVEIIETFENEMLVESFEK